MSYAVSANSAQVSTRYRYRWLVFAAMLAGEAMDVLDITIMNVAAPSIGQKLGAGPAKLQWAISAYALAMGAGLIVGGRLGDTFGRRRMFLIAMTAFACTSLLCAAAPGIDMLIAGRFLQGVAGALLLPQGFALLHEVFEPDELPRALAIFGPVMGCASIAGPVISGGIIHANVFDLGWRFALAVNAPIALIALGVAWRALPRTPRYGCAAHIDIAGAALVTLASVLLVLPLIDGREAGWPLWTWLSLGAAFVSFAGFALQQRMRVKHGRMPLVEPGIFSRRAFSAGVLAMALFFSALTGIQLVLTLFLQLGLGLSAGIASITALPQALAAFLGSAISGAVLLERFGKHVIQIGAVLQLASTAGLHFALSSQQFGPWELAPWLVLAGLGQGFIMGSLITTIITAIDDREAGSGSGVLAAVQAISSSAGIAGFSSLFFMRLGQGSATGGYQLALVAQVVLLIGFLAITRALPARTRTQPAA